MTRDEIRSAVADWLRTDGCLLKVEAESLSGAYSAVRAEFLTDTSLYEISDDAFRRILSELKQSPHTTSRLEWQWFTRGDFHPAVLAPATSP